jgi:myo-inositol-1(or 4)-monophosphatase
MLSKEQTQQCLAFAIKTAVQSGSIAMKYFRHPTAVCNKASEGTFDPVTAADREIESYIREKISGVYPTHGIIGEEHEDKIGTGNCTWFIDPIDGTCGYVVGSPMWGTLLGMLVEDQCALGLMHQPFVQETYIGSADGAYIIDRNGKQKIQTSDTEDIASAVLCCTHQSMFKSTQDKEAYDRVATACRLSRLGTDCYGYVLLAHGFVDIVIENELKAYDAVPLIPIVEAAGGLITDWDGNTARAGGRIVASANAVLHENVLKLVAGSVI